MEALTAWARQAGRVLARLAADLAAGLRQAVAHLVAGHRALAHLAAVPAYPVLAPTGLWQVVPASVPNLVTAALRQVAALMAGLAADQALQAGLAQERQE